MALSVRPVIALTTTFGCFAASFALHIVGGATDQGWLFAIAVALIFLCATGFPAIALLLTRGRATGAEQRVILGAGGIIGIVLTASALWAANGRTFAWWHPPVAIVLVVVVSAVLLAAARMTGTRGTHTNVVGRSA